MSADSNLTDGHFEFLIIHPDELEILDADFDNIMTPQTLNWTKVFKDDWPYYQIGADEYSYSMEPPGIQMTFNKEISYEKAKNIADEVVEKLKKYSNLDIGLLIINSQDPLSFP